MKKYCFDTSGFSNPLETMPEDIHESMWAKVRDIVSAGHVAVTREIFEEMERIPGEFGEHLKAHKAELVLEVGANSWNSQAYKTNLDQIVADHQPYISEYCGGKKEYGWHERHFDHCVG